MAKMMFPESFLVYREAMGNADSITRQNAVESMIIQFPALFPRCGTMNGSRKHGDRLYAVPCDLLHKLLEAAAAKEYFLRECVAVEMELKKLKGTEGANHGEEA